MAFCSTDLGCTLLQKFALLILFSDSMLDHQPYHANHGLSPEVLFKVWAMMSKISENKKWTKGTIMSPLLCLFVFLSVCSLCNVNKESKQRYAHYSINHCQNHYLFPYIPNPRLLSRYSYPDKCLLYFVDAVRT